MSGGGFDDDDDTKQKHRQQSTAYTSAHRHLHRHACSYTTRMIMAAVNMLHMAFSVSHVMMQLLIETRSQSQSAKQHITYLLRLCVCVRVCEATTVIAAAEAVQQTDADSASITENERLHCNV